MDPEIPKLSFDLVIVGAGVAGCVLASRISHARPHLRILLLEAGVDKDDRVLPTLGIMGGFDSNLEWNYRSVPQARGFGGEVVNLTSGKIVGGGSAVNYQTFTRGPAVDYDQWAELVQDPRWSWSSLLPYFKKSETWFPSADLRERGLPTTDLHGHDGPIKVSHATNSGRPRNYPLREKSRRFHELRGCQHALDINGGNPEGYAEAFNSTYEGLRSYAAGYGLGENVTLWTRSLVEKIVVEQGAAKGVVVLRSVGDTDTHERFYVEASKEVILSAGAQSSPKILLLSGIGPTAELARHQIAPILDLPVGRNYADHPAIFTYWAIDLPNAVLGDGEMQGPDLDWTAGLPYDWISFAPADQGTRELARQFLPADQYQRYSAEGKLQVEAFTVYTSVDTCTRTPLAPGWPGKRVFSIAHILVDPVSRGTVTLRSADPADPPILDPNLLASPVDRSALYECVRSCARAIQAVEGLNAVEWGVDDALREDWSDEAIESRARKMGAGTVFHPSGTCAMGQVVDGDCRVLGIQGLRVVDAGVIPIPLAAHYQAPMYGVAERAAEIVLGEV
ncbi:GMC family oxidoreductase [Aspergillus aculeatinus CBS 121060]|uniref:Glucose dehydrogenase n=1 Tax=Aspergillus aculeatinus CBS 121060 TaxID=1448322 RepID=A0ACD1H8U8_9EURO|nr:glucose dehydrogenase [Aspergillus aculeatinus CBS 121060]RAH70007.1 glucose dehydrogenase [Aspergillus aculeatinus CBS 121060]